MTISLAPPPLQVPAEFAADRLKGAFFTGLLNTLYQLWTTVYSIRFKTKVKTTDATVTALVRTKIPENKSVGLVINVAARRTGGSSGTNGDSAFYTLTGMYKNVGGVLTGVGVPDLVALEDQPAWTVGFTSSGTDAVVTVTGAAGNNITWEGTLSTFEVGA